VEEAFYERDDVLTFSVHESGLYLYPGTGFVPDTGSGPGEGYALNLPLPPGADDECYRIAFDDAIAPAVTAFAPDVIVAQLGADAHRNDPLTMLGLSVAGHEMLSKRIVALAEKCCGGRLAATGGGGYDTFNAVPREWVCALAAMICIELPEEIPESWREQVARTGQRPVPATLHEEHDTGADSAARVMLVMETARAVERLHEVSPLLGA
jgi:acetoin utilization protein AcuC